MDIALYHVRTIRAGEADYYAPRPRGHLEVWHDSKRYLYDVRGARISGREAQAFIRRAWDSPNGPVRLRGQYPSYEVIS